MEIETFFVNKENPPVHNSVEIYHMNTQSEGYNSVRNKSASTWNLIVNKISTDVITESTIKVKRATKSYFMLYLCMVIISFNTDFLPIHLKNKLLVFLCSVFFVCSVFKFDVIFKDF